MYRLHPHTIGASLKKWRTPFGQETNQIQITSLGSPMHERMPVPIPLRQKRTQITTAITTRRPPSFRRLLFLMLLLLLDLRLLFMHLSLYNAHQPQFNRFEYIHRGRRRRYTLVAATAATAAFSFHCACCSC
jgi:hypothetical protein